MSLDKRGVLDFFFFLTSVHAWMMFVSVHLENGRRAFAQNFALSFTVIERQRLHSTNNLMHETNAWAKPAPGLPQCLVLYVDDLWV